MSAPWVTALDTQMDLMRFWQSETGERYSNGFQESWDGGASITSRGAWLRRSAGYALKHGETFWVSPDMMTLNEATCENVPGYPLRIHDLPCANGFVMLPRPVLFRDVRGVTLSFRAFSWTTSVADISADQTAGAVAVFFYSRRGDDVEATYKWELLHYHCLPFESADWDDPEHWKTPNWVTPEMATENMPEAVDSTIMVMKFVVAFWSRVKEEILKKRPSVISRQGYIDRHLRKRCMRMDFPVPNFIKVVTLRREYDPGRPNPEKADDSEGSYLSHRFMVRAHWRWQWYPSRNCHERIPIDEYEKGPADAPFIPKKVVNRWIQ